MSLGSLYGGTPEEELEIWGKLIDPEQVPSAPDNEIAEAEEISFAGSDYQARQAESDELNDVPPDIAQAWRALSESQQASARQFLEALRTTTE